MTKWKITYKDNTPDEVVAAGDYKIEDTWTKFSDGSGAVVSIRTGNIQRIDRVKD